AEGDWAGARLSPDGRRAVVQSNGRLRVVDLTSGTVTPLAAEFEDTVGSQGSGVWSPDGRTVTFASNHQGSWNIYTGPASGGGATTPVLKRSQDNSPQSYAPDGTLLFTTTGPSTGTDLWMMSPAGEARAWL